LYFSNFPYVEYSLNNGTDIKTVFVRNILRRVGLSDELKGSRSVFLEYDIKDGERPEHIAERVYGDVSYHWLVLLTNDIVDPYHGWCKSSEVLEQYVAKKYSGYSVYITNRTTGSTLGWFYNTKVRQGATLTQGSKNSAVEEYHPEFCRLIIRDPDFSVGDASITGVSGNSYPVYIHRIEPERTSLNHFRITRPSGSCGAVEKVVVDPLSQQTNSYDYIGGYVSGKEDIYPIVDASGLCYDSSINGTVDLWETYIGRYMGISGTSVNQYSVANNLYEIEENEKKRTIKILHPRYKKQAVQELQSLLGA
jgi:hypothetical protein